MGDALFVAWRRVSEADVDAPAPAGGWVRRDAPSAFWTPGVRDADEAFTRSHNA